MLPSPRRSGWCALCVALAVCGAARARPAGTGAEDLAAAGVKAFKARDYRVALDRFLAAYRLQRMPEVVWNVGRCHEELDDPESALPYFEEFRATAPDAETRALADARIAEVRARIEARRPRPAPEGPPPQEAKPAILPAAPSPIAAPAPAPIAAAVPKPRVSAVKAGLFWGGLGAAVLGASLHVGGYVSWRDVSDGTHTYPDVEAGRKTTTALYGTAYALYGVAAAAVAASFLVPSDGRHPLGFAAAPAPGGASLVASLRW